ncbi:MAG: helix-turn-helix transcriptional regulator [Vulcanimicrobiaceae bacterium]|jgi:DNA-binding NarL/FixJ family response regulator
METRFRRCGIEDITDLEQRVIALLAAGLHSKEIATKLDRRKATIEGYVRILFLKFNVRSRAQLVAAAFLSGLLGREPGAHEDLISGR